VGEDQGGEAGGDRDREDQADGADEHADDLDRDELAGDDAHDGDVALGEEQQEGQRRAGVGEHQGVHGGRDVIAPDLGGLGVERADAHLGLGAAQRGDSRDLGDGDVVEDTQGADHDPGDEQASQVEGFGGEPQCLGFLRRQARQLRAGRHDQGQQAGDRQGHEAARERDGAGDVDPVGQVDRDVRHRHGADQRHEHRG
jgi:hypothetical protein